MSKLTELQNYYITRLEDALCDLLDGESEFDIQYKTGHTPERSLEIYNFYSREVAPQIRLRKE